MTGAERATAAARAVEYLEEVRPVGVRLTHNIDVPLPGGVPSGPGAGTPADNSGEPATFAAPANAADLFLPVDVRAELAPASLALTAAQRKALEAKGRKAVEDFFKEAGIGEALVYHRLIALLMQIDGVLDVALDMYPSPGGKATGTPLTRTRNVVPDNPGVKPVAGSLEVSVGGALVVLDVTVAIALEGVLKSDDATTIATNTADVRQTIENRLKNELKSPRVATINVAELTRMCGGGETYGIKTLHYTAEYVESGARIRQQDVALALSGLERIWIRKLGLLGGAGS
jgi:hypothetical protein